MVVVRIPDRGMKIDDSTQAREYLSSIGIDYEVCCFKYFFIGIKGKILVVLPHENCVIPRINQCKKGFYNTQPYTAECLKPLSGNWVSSQKITGRRL